MFKPLLRNMSGLVRPLIWQADLDCQGSGLRGRAKTVPHWGGGGGCGGCSTIFCQQNRVKLKLVCLMEYFLKDCGHLQNITLEMARLKFKYY